MRRPTIAVLGGLAVLASAVPVSAYPSGGAIPPVIRQVIQVAGVSGVPDDAIGVGLNVTVTDPAADGFVTVFPCGDRPLASNLNFVAGQTVPNFVVSGLDERGAVCIATMSTTDVVVDLAGYVPAGSALVPLAAPQRFLDTREGLGAPRARLAGLSVLHVPLAGTGSIPGSAGTVVFNATAVAPVSDGFLTVFPCGQPIPETSTLNFSAGRNVPNLVTSQVGPNGDVCFFSNVETDLVADLAAYMPAGAAGFTTLERPHRLVDTRIGLGGPQAPVDPPARRVQVGGQFGVPPSATAAIVNLTATDASASGYAAAFPCGGDVPFVSNLNFVPGANSANMAIVKLAQDGSMCLTANRAVDIVVDVSGYIESAASFVPLTPTRLFDSREGFGPSCDLVVRVNGSAAELVDLRSGQVTVLGGLPSLVDYSSPAAYITPDCVVYFTVNFRHDDVREPPGFQRSFVFDRNGSLLTSSFFYFDYTAFPTTYGLLYVRQGYNQPPQVVSWDTGQVVFDLPDMGQATGNGNPLRLWRPMGASSDGTLLAFSVVGSDGTGQLIGYFSIDGEQIALVPYEFEGSALTMSPDGAYVAGLVGTGAGPSDFQLVVSTIAGDEVARAPTTGRWSTQPPPRFVGTGSIIGCYYTADSTPLTRWDLFSPPVPIAAGRPNECPLAAG